MKVHQLFEARAAQADAKLEITETAKAALRDLISTFKPLRSRYTHITLAGVGAGVDFFKIGMEFKGGDKEYLELVKTVTLKHAKAVIDRHLEGLEPWDDEENFPKWEKRDFYLVGDMPAKLRKKFKGIIHVTAKDV